jgi:dTDP-glucose 4,6-dehydratase/UDP-glucose 4-epimerase
MSARKHYLVTGGSGFIGAAVVRRLLAAGHRVRILDNHSRGSMRRLADVAGDVELATADVRDADAVSRAACGVDAVVHLAYVNGTEFFYSKPWTVLEVGVRGMLNVLDACRLHDVPELVLASTSEVYQTPPTVPTPEEVPLCVPDVMNPRYSYGGGKIACELLAINFGRTHFDRLLVFRPHNVYGPDMGTEHVLPQMIERAVEAIDARPSGPVPLTIQGDGRQTRAFVHVADFGDAFMAMLERGVHLGIYNIGNPEELAIADVATRIVRYFGREPRLEHVLAPAGATPHRCPDIAKLAALGYHPRISFDAGLPSVADWYAAHRRGRSNARHPEQAVA